MPTEREKMLAGELYDPLDPELVGGARPGPRSVPGSERHARGGRGRAPAHPASSSSARGGDSVWMQPPFFCDYGSNIYLGERVFFNFNCVVLDVCAVRIGDFTLFGPAVQIYTATHPLERRAAPQAGVRQADRRSAPTSGSAAAAIICPGVTIGIACRHRRRQRGHARHPRRRVRRRQPVPRHQAAQPGRVMSSA